MCHFVVRVVPIGGAQLATNLSPVVLKRVTNVSIRDSIQTVLVCPSDEVIKNAPP